MPRITERPTKTETKISARVEFVIGEAVLAVRDVAVLEDTEEIEVGAKGTALKNKVTLEGSEEIVIIPLVLL